MTQRHLRIMIVVAAVIVAATLTGCAGDSNAGTPPPPVVYFGQSECEACRMIISDERYAAALVVIDKHGRHQGLAFDDIGCLLQHEANEPDVIVAARYIKDAEHSDWLDAATATYLHSQSLTTPMAFHVAALRTRERAAALQAKHPGDVLDFQSVAERFKAGTLQRF